METAIDNARNADKQQKHFKPEDKSTKVYRLAESLLAKIGKNDFDKFLEETLPRLIQIDIEKSKVSKRRK